MVSDTPTAIEYSESNETPVKPRKGNEEVAFLADGKTTVVYNPSTNKQNQPVLTEDPLSPNTMAEAAYAAGVASRNKLDDKLLDKNDIDSSVAGNGKDDDEFLNKNNKRRRLFEPEQQSFDPLIKESSRAIDEVVTAMSRKTDQNEDLKQIVFRELDNFIQGGLNAFHDKDELARELVQVKELSESRGRDVQRLKASEENSRASLSVSKSSPVTDISFRACAFCCIAEMLYSFSFVIISKNLLKAVETSKSSARDMCRSVQTEARLRGDVSNLRSERDTVIGEGAESKRKVILLEEEVRLLKARVARLTHDKIKVERDSRAALSLARSMDNHNASDVDYYKRKVSMGIQNEFRFVFHYRINLTFLALLRSDTIP